VEHRAANARKDDQMTSDTTPIDAALEELHDETLSDEALDRADNQFTSACATICKGWRLP
jgi:hypothetical protein